MLQACQNKKQIKALQVQKAGHIWKLIPESSFGVTQHQRTFAVYCKRHDSILVKSVYYELTLYIDLWNNEIVCYALSAKRGDRMTYINGLENLLKLKKKHSEIRMILHSDQGAVYASKAYNDLLPMYVNRSMTRVSTPTDNAAMESINGWIKAELFNDFHVTGKNSVKKGNR